MNDMDMDTRHVDMDAWTTPWSFRLSCKVSSKLLAAAEPRKKSVRDGLRCQANKVFEGEAERTPNLPPPPLGGLGERTCALGMSSGLNSNHGSGSIIRRFDSGVIIICIC